jgi:hypothetical protein
MTLGEFGSQCGLVRVAVTKPVEPLWQDVEQEAPVWTVRARMGEIFALAGDSGSLVVTEDGAQAIGIVFAANRSGDFGWIIPMPYVLTAFGGLRLVGGHGI